MWPGKLRRVTSHRIQYWCVYRVSRDTGQNATLRILRTNLTCICLRPGSAREVCGKPRLVTSPHPELIRLRGSETVAARVSGSHLQAEQPEFTYTWSGVSVTRQKLYIFFHFYILWDSTNSNNGCRQMQLSELYESFKKDHPWTNHTSS